jgi:hypothetical protein
MLGSTVSKRVRGVNHNRSPIRHHGAKKRPCAFGRSEAGGGLAHTAPSAKGSQELRLTEFEL